MPKFIWLSNKTELEKYELYLGELGKDENVIKCAFINSCDNDFFAVFILKFSDMRIVFDDFLGCFKDLGQAKLAAYMAVLKTFENIGFIPKIKEAKK